VSEGCKMVLNLIPQSQVKLVTQSVIIPFDVLVMLFEFGDVGSSVLNFLPNKRIE